MRPVGTYVELRVIFIEKHVVILLVVYFRYAQTVKILTVYGFAVYIHLFGVPRVSDMVVTENFAVYFHAVSYVVISDFGKSITVAVYSRKVFVAAFCYRIFLLAARVRGESNRGDFKRFAYVCLVSGIVCRNAHARIFILFFKQNSVDTRFRF